MGADMSNIQCTWTQSHMLNTNAFVLVKCGHWASSRRRLFFAVAVAAVVTPSPSQPIPQYSSLLHCRIGSELLRAAASVIACDQVAGSLERERATCWITEGKLEGKLPEVIT